MKLKYSYYRIRQFCLSAFLNLVPLREAVLINGEGSMNQIPAFIKKAGQKKIFIITTPGFIRRGSLEPFFCRLKEENIAYAIFSEVQPDPTTDCIEQAAMLYRSEHCEAMIAIGGGSVIDCAKAVGAKIARPKKTLSQMSGMLKVLKKIPDIYAVPTTAGTGSEATAGAVITNPENHYKFTVLDLCLVPKYAVLDAQFTSSLSAEMTAVTGMDALTHAIEAYTNRFCFPKAKRYAQKAVTLIYENLLTAYENGNDKNAREHLLLASYYAGMAINYNFIGYVHAIAHSVGGLYGVTHGKANAVILPYVLEAFGVSVQKKLAELSECAGLVGTTQEERAEAMIASIRELNQKMGIPKTLSEVKTEDFDTMIQRAVKEGNPTYPVPVIWEEEQFREILKRLHG